MPQFDPSLSITPSEIPERFPGLIAATDIPTLQVAVASATYMREGLEAPCPMTDSMVDHTARLLRQAERDTRHTEVGLGLRSVYQHMHRQFITKNRTLALIAFTGHQVAHSEKPVYTNRVESLFWDAMNVSEGIARPAIIKYCGGLASKNDRDLTDNERIAILAGEEVMSLSSLFPIDALRIAGNKRIQAIIGGFSQ